LEGVHVAELEEESVKLTQPYLDEMSDLVRARKVHLHQKREELDADWHETELDGKRVFISIH